MKVKKKQSSSVTKLRRNATYFCFLFLQVHELTIMPVGQPTL